MAKTARSLVDVILGEATHGTKAQRLEDMKAIASVIENRAAALGVSIQDVISAPSQFDAYGKSLPPGVEAYRDLAEQAIAEVRAFGPTHAGTFYATPSATKNLPSGLQPVSQTKGHVYFDDPKNRSIATAQGYKTPNKDMMVASIDPLQYTGAAAPASAKAAPYSQNPFDALFSATQTAPAIDLASIEPSARAASADQFSNPLGAFTDRVTSEFGSRTSPMGIGSTNHAGVDMSAQPNTSGYPAEAAAGGVVTQAGRVGGYGNMVEVQHEDGSKTRYGHLQSINVQPGQQIARGTPVGLVGNKGKSTGPHLHFEVIDKLGNKVDPRSVTDFSNRSLSVTPSQRPSTAVNSFADLALAGPMGFAAQQSAPSPSIDPSRFGGAAQPSQPAQSSFSGQMSSYAPSQDRFGYDMASGPFSPSGGYAVASAPEISGGLGGLGGMKSTQKADRLTSPMSQASATPMANNLTQPMSIDMNYEEAKDVPTSKVTTVSVAPTAMDMLALDFTRPAGPASTFNPVPTNLSVDVLAKNPLTSVKTLATSVVPPSLPAAVAPAVQKPATPAVAPAVARTPTNNMATGSVRSNPRAGTAADVYAGRADVGVATDGSVVSRDAYGNISITNEFGVTTTTDPTGRQMGGGFGLGGKGVGQGIGNAIGNAVGSVAGNVTPGMIGTVIGGAVGGPLGAMAGAAIGGRMGGGKSQGQRSGGLGGLGGFLSGIFGGGGGSSSGGGSGGRGSSSSGGGGWSSPGADRSQAGM